MIGLYICEDNLEYANKLYQHLNNHILFMNYDMEIVLVTDDPEKVLNTAKKREFKQSIYFLDIDLNHQMNSIDLAVKIRQHDILSPIIFITTYDELIYSAAEHHVAFFNYILKDQIDDLQKEVKDCLDKIHLTNKKLGHQKEFFVRQYKDQIISMPYSDILFFQKVPNKKVITLVSKHGDFTFPGNISDCVDEERGIYSPHESFAANILNALGINEAGNAIIYPNNESCPISYRNRGFIKQLFLNS